MELKDNFYRFTDVRKPFEEFIIKHNYHLSALIHDGGSKMKSAKPILDYWKVILNAIAAGREPLKALEEHERYTEVAKSVEATPIQKSGKVGKVASIALKLRETLVRAQPCAECGARIYNNARTHGHDMAVSAGGSGHSDNLGYEHPYCNTGHKTQREHLATIPPVPPEPLVF